MSHELELERERKHAHPGRNADHSTVGRSNASASLASPSQPSISGILMRKASGGAAQAEPEHAVERAGASGGQGLDPTLREKFEGSLGTDLSGVRVHTGAESNEAASAVGAHAYAIGNDIHFADGQYDPHSTAGQELIAHEVAHTVQQRGGSPSRQNKLAVSDSHDAAEREADAAASAMVRGEAASVSSNGTMISRQESGMQKPGAEQEKKDGKRDSTKVSIPDQSISIKLLGKEGKIRCTEAGPEGSLKLGELAKETSLLKMREKFPVQFPGAPAGLMLVLEGDVKAKAEGSIEVTCKPKEYPGPRENNYGYEGSVVPSASMTLTASGTLRVVGYVGAGFANLNAGGYVTLSGSVGTSLTGGGAWSISPDGIQGGNASVELSSDLNVKGTGGLCIGYEALVAGGTLYEVELVSRDFLTGKIGKKSAYDFASGAATETDTSEPLKWKEITWAEPKIAKRGVKSAADKAMDKIKADQKKQGVDLDGKQSIAPDEKTTSDENDCDPSNATCDPEA